MAKVDENDRVIKGYEGIVNFFSHLVLGRDLTKEERELNYYNGYFPKIGIVIEGDVYLFNTEKLEEVEDRGKELIVKYNLGDPRFRDIETISFSLDKFGVIEIGGLLMIFKPEYFVGVNIFDKNNNDTTGELD